MKVCSACSEYVQPVWSSMLPPTFCAFHPAGLAAPGHAMAASMSAHLVVSPEIVETSSSPSGSFATSHIARLA